MTTWRCSRTPHSPAGPIRDELLDVAWLPGRAPLGQRASYTVRRQGRRRQSDPATTSRTAAMDACAGRARDQVRQGDPDRRPVGHIRAPCAVARCPILLLLLGRPVGRRFSDLCVPVPPPARLGGVARQAPATGMYGARRPARQAPVDPPRADEGVRPRAPTRRDRGAATVRAGLPRARCRRRGVGERGDGPGAGTTSAERPESAPCAGRMPRAARPRAERAGTARARFCARHLACGASGLDA